MSNSKQTLIRGALTGTFGLLLSKALGILYIVPLTSLAGTGNMAFYSISYTYYNILLNISAAGIPFALNKVASKYYGRNDYKTIMLLRKFTVAWVMAFSFVLAIVFAFSAGPLATLLLESSVNSTDVIALRNIFWILALSVAIVPTLSTIRGFYQSSQNQSYFAISQVIEQVTRIIVLLVLGYIFVKLFSFDSIYAIYAATFAAFVAAIISLIYYFFVDRKEIPKLKKLVNDDIDSDVDLKKLAFEMVGIAIPYVIAAFLGNAKNLINTSFFINYVVENKIYSYDNAKVILSLYQTLALKIIGIPSTLAIGFTGGSIPFIARALEKKDYRQINKYMNQIIMVVSFIGLFLNFLILIFAKPVYFLLYGRDYLELGSYVLQFAVITGVLNIIVPISTNMAIALDLRRKNLIYLVIGLAVKFISFFILISLFAFKGIIYSSALSSILILILNLSAISKNYQVDFKKSIHVLFLICISLLAVNGGVYLMEMILPIPLTSRFITFLYLGFYGIYSLILYYLFSSLFNLPNYLFRLNSKRIIKIIRGRVNAFR